MSDKNDGVSICRYTLVVHAVTILLEITVSSVRRGLTMFPGNLGLKQKPIFVKVSPTHFL